MVESSAHSYKELLLERQARVLIVKINRPNVRNALNRRTYFEIIRLLKTVEHDPEITMVVLTGVGDAFSAGNDLSETGASAAAVSALSSNAVAMEEKRQLLNREAIFVLLTLINSIVHFPKILIALVNGLCVGMGFTLAAMCDVVYCTENAYFDAPFTRLGLSPEMCSSYLFQNILGRSKAFEVLMLGAKLSAEEALQFNFVARIFKNDELDSDFWPKMYEYSMLPTASQESTKRLLNVPIRQALLDAFGAESKVMRRFRLGELHSNGALKFLNARKKNKSKL